MSATNHAAIAKAVWPDIDSSVHDRPDKTKWCWVNNKVGYKGFNLLETDSDGNPTQQAKASALDVLVWLVLERPDTDVYELFCYSACAAIYKAACEVLELK